MSTIVYSHIIYAMEVWGSAFKTELDKILILQKRDMRLMTFNDVFPAIPGPLSPTDPIFVKLKHMKVQDIHKYQPAKFVFKCLNQTAPEQFHNWLKLTRGIHEHHTRSNFNVNDGTRTTNYGLEQLKVNGPRIWNDLPSHLKNVTSLNVFLKNVKLYYISGYV